MTHIFIINPFAGHQTFADDLRTKLAKVKNLDYFVFNTRYKGYETELVRKILHIFEGEKLRFYCCGGSGTMRNMLNGFSNVLNDLNREDVVEKFGVEVCIGSRSAVNNGSCLGIYAKLNRCFATLDACINESFLQARQKVFCKRARNQADLLGIANRGARGFGVFDDIQCHIEIGFSIHVNGTNACSRLDTRNLCILYASANKACTAARNEQINVLGSLHQFVSPCAGGIFENIDKGCE